MTRSANFRTTGNDKPDPQFESAVLALTDIAADLTKLGRDSYLSVATDIEYDEHPERDALLALADKWRMSPSTRECGDELNRLLATLSL